MKEGKRKNDFEEIKIDVYELDLSSNKYIKFNLRLLMSFGWYIFLSIIFSVFIYIKTNIMGLGLSLIFSLLFLSYSFYSFWIINKEVIFYLKFDLNNNFFLLKTKLYNGEIRVRSNNLTIKTFELKKIYSGAGGNQQYKLIINDGNEIFTQKSNLLISDLLLKKIYEKATPSRDLQTLNRWAGGTKMDEFTYNYNTGGD